MTAVFLSSLVVNVCQIGETGRPVPKWLRKVKFSFPLNIFAEERGRKGQGAWSIGLKS